ncbi:bleomycin resistance family protein [Xanthomonas sp. GW]|uniref:VOC family protein n=1 Tax=Xanthomonas sp. GW TaxID=2724121 RepID=UPI00163B3AB0|nr:VOC family protein [Xanthomonas sp. GW]QNH21955.1 bleomycin resistance family protein [Xanthomonas sp. GW]
MTFTALTPMLRSTDLVAALAFYTDTLDFRIDGGGADAGWASLRHGPLALMLATQQAPTGAAAAGFPGSLYFRTDDVDAWWQRLQPHARIAYPLEDFAYGMREFAIHDPDGHLLQFGQALCR